MATQRKLHSLSGSGFYRMSSPHKLAALLKMSIDDLESLATSCNRLYREWDEKKPNGDSRHIEAPSRPLKRVQARIAHLLSRIEPADYLFCPVKRRCYVTNAARHRGNRVVRCLDIKKYFPSTPSRRVYWFWHSVMQCSQKVAGLLTALSTFEEHLPTGSPLSAIMAYFAHIDVWEAVAEIANKHGYVLTVYMDDVTLSGAHVRTEVLWEIKHALHAGGLRYHKEKAYFDRPAEITGVIVAGTQLKVPHRQYRKLRQASLEIKKIENAGSKQIAGRIDGLRGQMNQIRAVALEPHQ
jgi:hypothetical protein